MLFSSLWGYRRSWLPGDLLAAVSLLVIAVPEQLATARLAGMPPVDGFYAFAAGTVLFAVFGSSRQLSVGADSTIAPLFAVAVGAIAVTGSARYTALVAVLAVLVGVAVMAVGLLRLGWIAEFLSAPIISGFMAGVAVIIVVHQLPDLLGLPSSAGSTTHRIIEVTTHLSHLSLTTLAIGLAVLAVIGGGARIDRRFPAALVAVLASTILVAVVRLDTHGVATLGSVAHQGPHLGLTDLSWSTLRSLAPIAAVVALVVISQTAATTRAFADRGGYPVDLNRDFLGVGAGSVAAGIIGAFPVDASPPRTAAAAAAGGRSQAAGLAAVAVIIGLIPALGSLRDLPQATLAAVLIIVGARIFPVRDLRNILRFNRVEFALALITLLAVALIGVQEGIGVAVGLAILDRTRLTSKPQLHVLGRIPASTSWAPLSGAQNAEQVPGVLVVLFATPLWYANAAHFRAEITAARSRAVGTLSLIVLDAVGMSDIDYTGAGTLSEVLDGLDHDDIHFAIARAGAHARDSLQRSGLLDRIGAEDLYPTVDQAVTALPRPTAADTTDRAADD